MSLKVVKFDTKMYLNFSNFRGRTSAGGGLALVQKWGQVSDGGGIGKIFARWGRPPHPPQEKNPDQKLLTNKLISKISVDSNFVPWFSTSYAYLCVFHGSHRLLC